LDFTADNGSGEKTLAGSSGSESTASPSRSWQTLGRFGYWSVEFEVVGGNIPAMEDRRLFNEREAW